MNTLIYIAFLTPYIIYMALKFRNDVHMFQLNSYMNNRFFRWINENKSRYFNIKGLIPLVALIGVWYDNLLVVGLIWSASYIMLILLRNKQVEKKKLVYTGRVKRLFTAMAIIFLSIILLGHYFVLETAKIDIYLAIAAFTVLGIISFIFSMLANIINMPIELMINRWYYNDAKKKLLSMPNLTRIGITGSYGKTSTKFTLYKILSEKYNVVMTPESYNTTMGAIRTIRSMLKPIHEIFICEMGAREKGNIKEICDLVLPRYGILTAIGEQHLETFKNVETITKTKYELIHSLPKDGVAFLNFDNKIIRNQDIIRNTIKYGVNSQDLTIWAEDIRFTSKGSTFTVCRENGERAVFSTKLLGRHNISNIVAASAVACELGMTLEEISVAVKLLEPVPHRLEIKKTPQGITIIDDAYNSNPEGAEMALEVLGEFNSNNKVLITPGMVELGVREYELNKVFGTQASKVCDYIILVGKKRTQPIYEGLDSEGYSKDNIYIAQNLNEAISHMNVISKEDSVFLFVNDLPDTYNE